MNTINSARLLAEMNRMAQSADLRPHRLNPTQDFQPSQAVHPSEFGTLLINALGKVNDLSMTAGDLSNRLVQGDPDVSLAETMIAGQKASVAFEATLQVRNKLVQAYQDIMNMTI
ncbi:MAG: flagellar hook-basal body complex protein FliE [Gammaproteobacteria bacterium CG22_combo_CG10-13_8_21_14_all_40_8]|nr:MAG: flagellar hook-basal body complex protein FliE [Gammaproteobacteria bacterium CG22_combo_CG10-13_8_21_14_all_40_8]